MKKFGFFDFLKPKPKPTAGRGGPQEVPRRIEKFYPRGAAGRREVRGTSAPHKAVMPRKGNRPKYPK
jgi:hypothetical protein